MTILTLWPDNGRLIRGMMTEVFPHDDHDSACVLTPDVNAWNVISATLRRVEGCELSDRLVASTGVLNKKQ